MVVNLDDLSESLHAFDEFTEDEMRVQYRRSLRMISDRLDTAERGKRIQAARAFVVVHGLAVRYYVRFGEPINAQAFPGDRQQGDGPTLRVKGADNFSRLANLEDALFEFVAALRLDYRQEFLSLLEEGWIAKVIEP